MLNKIRITNFKAFEQAGFDIRPITLFLGPNNSGKSSALSILRVLSQTMQSYDQGVALLLNGALGDFGSYKDVVFGNNKRRQIEVFLSADISEKTSIDRLRLRKIEDVINTDGRRVIDKSNDGGISLRLKFRYRSSLKELILSELEVRRGGDEIIFLKYNDDSERLIIESVGGEQITSAALKASLSSRLRMHHFLPRSVFVSGVDRGAGGELSARVYAFLQNIPSFLGHFSECLSDLEYIGATRLSPLRSYLYSGERHKKVGVNGENAISIMAMDAIRKGKKSKQIRERVVKWLSAAKLASDLKIVSFSERNYELYVQNPYSSEYQNFADVGFGNSQVIPVLVGGYNLNPGSLFIVEEPEIHLHPNAQAELGEFFLDLYKNDIYSLVETHSEYLVVRLQQHVAAGLINPKDIVFYYVFAEGGKKSIKKLTLDENGFFLDEWPQGFFPQKLEETKKLAKLRMQKNAG
jgi:predicted ATPase